MIELMGRELEDSGQIVFARMDLLCVHRLNQVRLLDIDPEGPHSVSAHLEFDYLIPHKKTCLIGEITGRDNSSNLKSKYRSFRRHYNIVRSLELNESVWRSLGVPDEYLDNFRETDDVKGFFITTRLQRFDVDLPDVPGIARFYKVDWDLLVEYSQSIGTYAKQHFLSLFDIADSTPRQALMLSHKAHRLVRTPNKKIASGDVGVADVYTFEASPYELLPIAQVYRRDELPSLSSASDSEYQRPLRPKKLTSIRKKLLETPDFMFPNSILVVLSSNCRYLDEDETLIIPENYGAISVIDGQHRLFSYAEETIREQVSDDSRIMVTAIQFRDADARVIQEYSARAFVEINTNQTRVPRTLLDAIAYPILGETSPRAIAAQVILKANERKSSNLYGLFNTTQTGLGIIRAITVLTALKTITNIEKIKDIQNAQSGSKLDNRNGYKNLFSAEIDTLSEPEILIEQGVVCFEHYFNLVARVFHHDWPERGHDKNSSLEYAKMIAGFVKVLRQFISEGLDWQAVQSELENIRRNVMQLQDMQNYDGVLFDPSHQDIPNSQPSATDDYRFLNANRQQPTSIQKVAARRLGR